MNLTETQLGVVCALRRCGWSATEKRLLDELGVESWAEHSDETDPIPWSIVDRGADGVLRLTESPSEPCCAYCCEEEVTVPTVATKGRPWYLAREWREDGTGFWVVAILHRGWDEDRGVLFKSARSPEVAREDAWLVACRLNGTETSPSGKRRACGVCVAHLEPLQGGQRCDLCGGTDDPATQDRRADLDALRRATEICHRYAKEDTRFGNAAGELHGLVTRLEEAS